MSGDLTERRVIDIARRGARRGRGVRLGIGDDCAVLEPEAGALLLATTDLLVEDVHFRRRYTEPADLGWKSLAVNLSDIASMGGQPRWALVALACPQATPVDEVDAFYEGLEALAAEHDVAVVGGDTSSSPRGWMVNLTLLGQATRPILRSTARVGDVVAVTGTLGRSAAGLAVLQREAPEGMAANDLAELTGAHVRPVPRVREGQWLGHADGVTAMIDVSDGVATDLAHIAEESRVGARVDVTRVPVSEATRRLAHALGGDTLAWAASGGEDYELLLTCRPEAWPALQEGLRGATGTPVTAIGTVVDTPGVRFVDPVGAEIAFAPGWQHFARSARPMPRAAR